MKQITEMTEMREQHEAQMQSTQAHITNLTHNITVTTTREKELKANWIRMTNEISKKVRDLQIIHKQRDNKLILFGQEFPTLVSEIARNHRKVKLPFLANNFELIINGTKMRVVDIYHQRNSILFFLSIV